MSEIAIVGAGTMGTGLAQLAARHGDRVHLIDVDAAALDRARREIASRLSRQVERSWLTAEQRSATLDALCCTTALDRLDTIELAIEAVPEDLSLKRQVLAELAGAVPGAVLATNTSSLSVSKIAEALPTPQQLVGLHFFNPAAVMPLVELVLTPEVEDAAVQVATSAAQRWGKTCVRVHDAPGFIVNRVARGFYLEALRLFDEGVADIAHIDAVMREHAGFKLGPFELMDLVGVDVGLAVSHSLWNALGQPARLCPHPLQRDLVRKGMLGRKTGQGFYDHGQPPPRPAVQRASQPLKLTIHDRVAVEELGQALGAQSADEEICYLLCRILGAVFNEAAAVAEMGLATPADIDLAMRLGTNYPQGPLAWAASAGHATLRAGLNALVHHTGDQRFAPAPSFGER